MNHTIFNVELLGCGQDLSLVANGNKYYIDLSRGGFKYDETEFANVQFESHHSKDFDTYEQAFWKLSALLREFGRGDYSWEDRCKKVEEAK